MVTLKLRVSDKVLDKVIWLLKHFKKSELEIIEESYEFTANKKELHHAYSRIKNKEAKLYTLNEAEELFEKTIRENED